MAENIEKLKEIVQEHYDHIFGLDRDEIIEYIKAHPITTKR